MCKFDIINNTIIPEQFISQAIQRYRLVQLQSRRRQSWITWQVTCSTIINIMSPINVIN